MNIRKQYTSGQLSPEEFEQLTATLLEAKFDQETKQSFRLELAEKYGIRRPVPAKKIALKRIVWGAVAAAAAVLLLIGIFQLSPANDYQELTASHLAEYFPDLEDRKGATETDQVRSKAREAYSLQDFSQSVRLRKALTQLPQVQAEDYFYLAISYLYQHPPQRQQAIEVLERLQAAGNEYAQESRWFLALALISEGQITSAKNYLNIIVNTNSWKAKEAAALLGQLPT